MMKKPLKLTLPRRGFELHSLAQKAPGPLVLIVNDLGEKDALLAELTFFGTPAFDFPDWETLPYDPFSPHIDITSLRLRLLALMPNLKEGVVLIGAHTLLNPLPPPSFLKTHAFSIKTGDRLDLQGERTALANAGYRQVTQVFTHGEYAIRGSIFDIFPMGADTPYRLDLFDDEVESIRDFDIETQRSQTQFNNIELLPAHEFPFDPTAIHRFIQHFKKLPIAFEALKRNIPVQGLEYYLPLFFDACANFFDYCPSDTTLIFDHGLEKTWKNAEAEIAARFEDKRYDLERPPLPPRDLFWPHDDLFKRMKIFKRFELDYIPENKSKEGLKILYTAETPGRQQLLQEHLSRQNIIAQPIQNWQVFLAAPPGTYITVGRINLGWSDTQIRLISEAEVFGISAMSRTKRRDANQTKTFTGLGDLVELKLNDIVVHIEHGIGRYLGLSPISLTDQEPQEFITLEYLNGDKLYVPVHHIHLISRYSIGDLQNVSLSQLGSDRWRKTKEKAARRITDIAAELLELYAKRMATPGFAFNPPNEDYQEFVFGFPFEETEDQQKAIDEVIGDMIRPNPMDRLLCGDVGFGKTEVAMRASFLAVQSGKQVAILVPTTLLAEQHFENFQNRFARFPITIAHFSRNTSNVAEKEILSQTTAGKIDILIGTHKLIRGELQFKDLGLIIIDEEHRFGVKDKERLRSFKAHVDTLTMTATPIPRTLNFSLSMLRDLSIIATPPAKRLSIKTFVKTATSSLIKEAILREVLRGGQVYYLHNDVASIEQTRERLQNLLPQITVSVGHGQMRPRDLERVMADFYHNRAQVLVCSTIIETGIDIPNANTILIEEADRFGLAQLHQLRGRVGRSHHQAYAYFLVPDLKTLTKEAEKRLEAIERSTNLGSGFTLASHDLEIRGAGEVLGEGQSGHMEDIGFSLYNELLNRAIQAFQKGEKLDSETLLILDESEVELNIPRLFPSDYVPEVELRLSLYQRLQKITSLETLQDFKIELIDRFGPIPEASHNLLESERLKLLAKALGILRIDANAGQLKLTFSAQPKFEPLKLIRWVQQHSGQAQLRGEKELILKKDLKTSAERIATINLIFQALT